MSCRCASTLAIQPWAGALAADQLYAGRERKWWSPCPGPRGAGRDARAPPHGGARGPQVLVRLRCPVIPNILRPCASCGHRPLPLPSRRSAKPSHRRGAGPARPCIGPRPLSPLLQPHNHPKVRQVEPGPRGVLSLARDSCAPRAASRRPMPSRNMPAHCSHARGPGSARVREGSAHHTARRARSAACTAAAGHKRGWRAACQAITSADSSSPCAPQDNDAGHRPAPQGV